MIVVLSGEGPTDLGACSNSMDQCYGAEFAVGPLAVMVDKLLDSTVGYRPLHLHPDGVHFISKKTLEQRARSQRRGFALVSKKRGQETGFFYIVAWMLGELALDLEAKHDDRCIAVLHRDSDDRSESSADHWDRRFKSVLDGFARSEFSRGVPMLPRPISESWLLCAARTGLANCAALEAESASDKSPRPLKRQLHEALKEHSSAPALAQWIDGAFDAKRLCTMPSFARFREALDAAAKSLLPSTSAAAASER